MDDISAELNEIELDHEKTSLDIGSITASIEQLGKLLLKMNKDWTYGEKLFENMLNPKAGLPRVLKQPHLQLMFAKGYNPTIESVLQKSEKNSAEPEILTGSVRNSWYSKRLDSYIKITQDFISKKIGYYLESQDKLRSYLYEGTFHATSAWDLKPELRAMKKLRKMISKDQFESYILTGTFPETSKKSQVTYLFRRARPTLAFKQFKFLASLCLHPIAYYGMSWAGALVPTDDLIAHLLLMRGDEHCYWKKSTQHPGYNAQAAY